MDVAGSRLTRSPLNTLIKLAVPNVASTPTIVSLVATSGLYELMLFVAVGAAGPPFAARASVYVTTTVSVGLTLRLPLLLTPATKPEAVANVPANILVLGPVSVSVTVSISPVTLLTTVTTTVSATSAFTFKSASVTLIDKVSPGPIVGVIDTVPVVPPLTMSSAVRATAVPVALRASLYVTVTVSVD